MLSKFSSSNGSSLNKFKDVLGKIRLNSESVKSQLTSEDKDDLVTIVATNSITLTSVKTSGYINELFVLKDQLDAPDWFESLFRRVIVDTDDLIDVPYQSYIVNTAYYLFKNSYFLDKQTGKYCVLPSDGLLTFACAMICGYFPRLMVKAIKVAESTLLPDSASRSMGPNLEPIISDNKIDVDTKSMERCLIEISTYFMIYMSTLMFRKHGIFHIATGNRSGQTDQKGITIEQQFQNVYDSTNKAKYALVNLINLDEKMLKRQYFSELSTLDCLIQICLQQGLVNNTIERFGENMLLQLEKMIQDSESYNYKCGSLKTAYALCVKYFMSFYEVLPQFTFSEAEQGQPEKLSQFFSIRDAAIELSKYLNTTKGFAIPIKAIRSELEKILPSYEELIMLYHEGHPKYNGRGLAARDVWDNVISFIATLGKAFDIAIKEASGTAASRTQFRSWVEKPLFKYAPVSEVEVQLYADAIKNVYSKDNKATIKQFELSMAITSDMGKMDISSLSIQKLTQNI